MYPSGLKLQSGQGLVMKTLPNFARTIETFNGGLKPVSRGGVKTGVTPKLNQSRITPAAIGGAVISLEAGVIVELGVSRQARITPVVAHSRNDFGGWVFRSGQHATKSP